MLTVYVLNKSHNHQWNRSLSREQAGFVLYAQRAGAPHRNALARGYSGQCGGLQSWVLYDLLPMTGTNIRARAI